MNTTTKKRALARRIKKVEGTYRLKLSYIPKSTLKDVLVKLSRTKALVGYKGKKYKPLRVQPQVRKHLNIPAYNSGSGIYLVETNEIDLDKPDLTVIWPEKKPGKRPPAWGSTKVQAEDKKFDNDWYTVQSTLLWSGRSFAGSGDALRGGHSKAGHRMTPEQQKAAKPHLAKLLRYVKQLKKLRDQVSIEVTEIMKKDLIPH